MISFLSSRLAHRPLWQIDALGAAVVCAMAAAWYLLGLQPQMTAKAARLELEQELTSQREIASQTAEVVASQEKGLQTVQEQIAASAIRLRSVESLNQHVSDIAAAGTSAGLRIDEIKPAAPQPLPRFTTVPIRISGEGGYRSLTTFLGKLRSDFHDTGATGFELKRKDNSDATDLKFELNLVWYAAPSPAPAKKK